MARIYKELKFDAAHFVQTTETQCLNIHGHTWKVEVTLEGDTQEDGMLVDFTKIKDFINLFDHRLLVPTHLYKMDEHLFSL